jgi:prepilin-type N-terminal cleavage/methylation domain-containing protein
MNKQSGFTLVEIAIVLVIIGLLLGGVLKGQELITQAKIKNIANDLNGMTAAVYAYQDRYKRFPGDDNGAATRWPAVGSVAAATDGDGNAAVGAADVTAAASCTPTGTGENCTFWNHLRRSGFVAGNAASAETPLNAVGGFLHVQTNALGLTGLVICSTNLLGKVAGAIDAQFDDGNPATGTVRAGTALATNTAATAYVDDGATVYTVCKTI